MLEIDLLLQPYTPVHLSCMVLITVQAREKNYMLYSTYNKFPKLRSNIWAYAVAFFASYKLRFFWDSNLLTPGSIACVGTTLKNTNSLLPMYLVIQSYSLISHVVSSASLITH